MGHTTRAARGYNQKLSERRAGAVAATSRAGVTSSRIQSRGLGESVPVAANDSEEGRAQNRRVEFSIRVNEAFKAKAAQQQARFRKRQSPGGT